MFQVCSRNPESLARQADLKHAADDLVVVAYASAAELLNARVIRSLQAAARAVVSASNNLITTGRCAATKSRANNYHVRLFKRNHWIITNEMSNH